MTDRTVTEIAAAVRALGVTAGDLIMVHASLRAIGPVGGGAAGVIAAIDRAVGPEGTWMMVLGADETRPFDAQVTPAQPDVGALAEVFRVSSGTVVSDHPEGRFGARGRRADHLVADVPWHDYYGPGSPLDRLVAAGGKVLRLGADLDTVTVIHFAEYVADVPDKRRVTRHPTILTSHGPTRAAVSCLDDEHGIVDHPAEDYFSMILRAYLATGCAATGPVGGATGELLDAADLVAFAAAWMSANLDHPAD